MRCCSIGLGLIVIALAACCGRAEGAQFRLRTQCRPEGSIVCLGDVAEIQVAQPRQREGLESIELFAAPPPGKKRFVHAREIQDALALYGLDLARYRLTGSSQVEILGREEPGDPPLQGPVSNTLARRANQRVRQAILDYLDRNAPGEIRHVDFELADDQAAAVAAGKELEVIDGGSEADAGSRRFTLSLETPQGPSRLEVRASLSMPGMMVLSLRPLPAGTVVHATDVKLVPAESPQAGALESLDQVVGQETRRAVREGQTIGSDDVGPRLLVRRGDAVTVYARSAGVRVRTTARAQEEGGMGDLVLLESLLNRKKFFARVTGPQQADVLAH